jgi:hypothetical protein
MGFWEVDCQGEEDRWRGNQEEEDRWRENQEED